MIGKFKKLPLEKQLVWSFFLLASFVIALTMTISVFVDIRSERQQIDNTIGNIAVCGIAGQRGGYAGKGLER